MRDTKPIERFDVFGGLECAYYGDCPEFCYVENYNNTTYESCLRFPVTGQEIVETAMSPQFVLVFFCACILFTLLSYTSYREITKIRPH